MIKVSFVIILEKMMNLGAISILQNNKFVQPMMELIVIYLHQDGTWLLIEKLLFKIKLLKSINLEEHIVILMTESTAILIIQHIVMSKLVIIVLRATK